MDREPTTDDLAVAAHGSAWRFGWVDVLWMLALLAAGGLAWLPGLGVRGLWTSGEARAAQVARRMVAHGDYVTMRQQMREPRITVVGNEGADAVKYDPDGKVVVHDPDWRQAAWEEMARGSLRPDVPYEQRITIHKPVFYYWLIAIAHRVGMPVNNFTVRCFSAVPAMLLLAVTYLLGCVLYGRRVGLVAALALATCVQFWWQARICQMDMLLALMMTLVFTCWYVADRGRCKHRRAVMRCSLGTVARRRVPAHPFVCLASIYVLLAAASLMKSFAYMLLAGLIVLVYLGVEAAIEQGRGERLRAYGRRVWQVGRRMHVVAGAIVFLALVLPWFVLIHIKTDGQYTRTMFLHHMFSRAGLLHVGREFEKTT
ncbi:MAG: glycosyltransferase family 39 protein, partial [Phycisphaerae bacterium]|nr:glycosyltransferase family 39 protein [Phycisphaerae bacterium]